jgi:hypothetical protein
MDAYREHCDLVEIVLHPFLAPNDLPLSQFTADSYPSDAEILADCRPVAWTELIGSSGFANLSQIDIALRSHFLGLRRPDAALRDRLDRIMAERGLIPPDAGFLSPFVERAVLQWLAATGHHAVRVADELASPAFDLPISEMIGQGRVPPHGMIAAMDGAALLVTHWDSCCSFLCRKGDTGPVPGLEGFRCTDRTQVYWGLHPV